MKPIEIHGEGCEASTIVQLPNGKAFGIVVIANTPRDARRELANEVKTYLAKSR